jgi:hypothetical protein
MRKLLVAVSVASLASIAGAQTQTYYQGQPPLYPQSVNVTVPVPAPAAVQQNSIPDWFNSIPNIDNGIYSVGDGVSSSVSGALGNARANAFEGLCQHSGGTVRSQTKIFRQDTENGSTSMSTTSIRNFCADISVAGSRVEKSSVIFENGRYHAFVLVSLSTGASVAKTRKQQVKTEDLQTKTDAQKEFEELDSLNQQHKDSQTQSAVIAPLVPRQENIPAVVPVTPASGVPESKVEGIQLLDVNNAEYKARRDLALQKPGAVIGQTTLQAP